MKNTVVIKRTQFIEDPEITFQLLKYYQQRARIERSLQAWLLVRKLKGFLQELLKLAEKG